MEVRLWKTSKSGVSCFLVREEEIFTTPPALEIQPGKGACVVILSILDVRLQLEHAMSSSKFNARTECITGVFTVSLSPVKPGRCQARSNSLACRLYAGAMATALTRVLVLPSNLQPTRTCYRRLASCCMCTYTPLPPSAVVKHRRRFTVVVWS